MSSSPLASSSAVFHLLGDCCCTLAGNVHNGIGTVKGWAKSSIHFARSWPQVHLSMPSSLLTTIRLHSRNHNVLKRSESGCRCTHPCQASCSRPSAPTASASGRWSSPTTRSCACSCRSARAMRRCAAALTAARTSRCGRATRSSCSSAGALSGLAAAWCAELAGHGLAQLHSSAHGWCLRLRMFPVCRDQSDTCTSEQSVAWLMLSGGRDQQLRCWAAFVASII